MIINAVAVFEITCPSTAVSTNSPASSARGPKAPTVEISSSASSFAAPGLGDRGRERHHRPDEDHRRPVDRPVDLLDRQDPEHQDRPRRPQPGDRRRHQPGREQHHHPEQHQERRLRPRPHRQRLPPHQVRRVHHHHLGRRQVAVERGPGALQEQRVPGVQRPAGRELGALPLHPEHHEVAARGHHAGEQPPADQRRARRHQHLGQPRVAVEEQRLDRRRLVPALERQVVGVRQRRRRLGIAADQQDVAHGDLPGPHRSLVGPAHGDERHARLRQPEPVPRPPDQRRPLANPQLVHSLVEPELLDERPRMIAQVRRQRPALAHRQQQLPEHDRDQDGPDHQRDADERELEIAEPRPPGVERGLEHQHVHRRPGQRQHRAGVRPEHQRHQELRRRPLQPHRHHHDHRQQRRHPAVDADQRREDADEQHHQAGSAATGSARRRE